MPKFSYVRFFKDWGWVVGTGIYVDEAVREKLAETIADIRKIRYGSEYFWISTSERPSPHMVMHPIRPELDGQPLDVPEFELEVNGTRRNLFATFRDLTEEDGQGFAEYRWPRPTPEGRPGVPALKLSFVRRYAPLGWIIGTGKHIDDIEEAIARKTGAAEADVASLIRRLSVASLALGLVAMLAAGLLAVSLTRPLGRLVHLARELASDEKHLSRRLNLRARDEIGQLAAELDHMAARIERSFANVREQRELLQSVLSNLPHSIFWKDRNLVYLGCNEQFARTFGLPSAEEIVGKTDARLGWGDEERALQQRRDRAVLETGQPAPTERETLTGGAGRRASFLVSRVPLRDQAGNLLGLLGVLVELDEAPAPPARG
jgi:methyl-accepting chemotaxis protein